MPRQNVSYMASPGHSRQQQTRSFHTRHGYTATPANIWDHPALLRYGKRDPKALFLWNQLSQRFRYQKAPRKVLLGKGDNAVEVEERRGQALVSCRVLADDMAGRFEASPGYVHYGLRRMEKEKVVYLKTIKGKDGKPLGTLVTDRLGVREARYSKGLKKFGRQFGRQEDVQEDLFPAGETPKNQSVVSDALSDDFKIENNDISVPTHHPFGDNQKGQKVTQFAPLEAPDSAPPPPNVPRPPAEAAPQTEPAKKEDAPPEMSRLVDAWKALNLHQSFRPTQGFYLAATIIAVLAALKHVKGNVQRLILAMSLYSAHLDSTPKRPLPRVNTS